MKVKILPDGVQGQQSLQVMSLSRNGVWDWLTIDKDLQDACLQECIEKRIPHRLVTTPETKAIEETKDGVTQNFGKNNGIMPCPYCNQPEGENVILGYNYPRFMITCIPCSVTMKHDRKDKVIGFWNNRLFTDNGYQQRNNEIVKLIEDEIAKILDKGYCTGEREYIQSELLTTLLSTINKK